MQQYASLPEAGKFESFPKQNLSLLFSAASSDTLDLLSASLRYDPLKRPTAGAMLQHPYFRQGPLPSPVTQLPRPAQSAQAKEEAPPTPPAPKAVAAGEKRSLSAEDIAHRKRLAHRVAFS